MINKQLFVSIFIIILLGVGIYFSLQNYSNNIPNESISYLNNIYLSNQNEKSDYGLRVIPLESESEPAEMYVYFDKNNGLTKIVEVSYGGETFRVQYNYFFENENNFLLIEKYEKWDRPYSVDGRIKILDETNKYYFKNIDMIYWINSRNQSVNPQSNEFNKKEKKNLLQLEKFLSYISK